MAIGNPFETYNIAGAKIPRYKMSLYGIIGYVTLVTGIIQYGKFQPPKPTLYESKEEEAYVKRYVDFREQELKKPELLRAAYTGPAHL
ncbi:hypothetical protein HKX48_004006 [Thoreauomyces humboldtii]|nr:hypothetical protein HKX48_004006 [Thoreauomyces humboldtii]